MINSPFDGFRIILASRSPRRQELMKELGFRFEVAVRDWNEDFPSGLKAEEIALFVARSKAEAFKNELKDKEIVITADTIVWCNGRILDKPTGRNEAISILGEISGNTHEVITGVCLLSKEKESAFHSSTEVTFSALSDKEIEYYVDKYKPYDKAGGYGIQEWIGLVACSSIKGSYFNVMGLPAQQLYYELHRFVLE